MIGKKLDLRIVDTLVEPGTAEKKGYYKGDPNRPLYKVWLFIEGGDLPYVNSVTYILHSTFPDPVHKVWRSSAKPRCELVIWTWGIFGVKVEVEDKNGRIHRLSHHLTYGRQISSGEIELVAVSSS